MTLTEIVEQLEKYVHNAKAFPQEMLGLPNDIPVYVVYLAAPALPKFVESSLGARLRAAGYTLIGIADDKGFQKLHGRYIAGAFSNGSAALGETQMHMLKSTIRKTLCKMEGSMQMATYNQHHLHEQITGIVKVVGDVEVRMAMHEFLANKVRTYLSLQAQGYMPMHSKPVIDIYHPVLNDEVVVIEGLHIRLSPTVRQYFVDSLSLGYFIAPTVEFVTKIHKTQALLINDLAKSVERFENSINPECRVYLDAMSDPLYCVNMLEG